MAESADSKHHKLLVFFCLSVIITCHQTSAQLDLSFQQPIEANTTCRTPAEQYFKIWQGKVLALDTDVYLLEKQSFILNCLKATMAQLRIIHDLKHQE